MAASGLPTKLVPDTEIKLPQPTRLQKHLLLVIINLVGRCRRHNGRVLMLTRNLCVKHGSLINLTEAQTMMFVARHTNIPVPRVHLAFTHKGCTYILMERIRGQPVGKDWLRRQSSSQSSILRDLKKMVFQLRSLSSPGNIISSVGGGSLYDPRMPGKIGPFGPFNNVQEFHDYLRDGIQTHNNHSEDVKKLIALHHQEWHGPILTHGDLSSFNILVRGDEIVGIIDWETAGWYPAYWEYTTACQVNPQNLFWRDEIEKFLEAMPDALAMEQLRQRYFGDF